MKDILKKLKIRPQLLIALLFMASVAGTAWYYYGQVRTIPTSADTLSGLVGPAATCDYYTAPAVISGGDGSNGNPWDLQSALNTELMISGKTLCLKGGTYYGKFTSTLNGGTVQSAPGSGRLLMATTLQP